jgi:hypothetical protein
MLDFRFDVRYNDDMDKEQVVVEALIEGALEMMYRLEDEPCECDVDFVCRMHNAKQWLRSYDELARLRGAGSAA